jgi:ligand-binding SRPBCC domain-containing protein
MIVRLMRVVGIPRQQNIAVIEEMAFLSKQKITDICINLNMIPD